MSPDKDTISIDVSVNEWEKKVVGLLSKGKTIPEISKEIKSNNRRVEYRLAQLKARVNCNTAAQLVAFFLKNKLID
jgi:DNA-binding NarL/FixJ family response regulator